MASTDPADVTNPPITPDLLSGLSSMIEASPIGYGFVVHPERTIAYVNPSLARMAGVRPADMLGKGPGEVFGMDLAREIAPRIYAALDSPAGQGEIEVTAELPGRPGHQGVYRLNVYAVRGSDGRQLGTWYLVHEVTKERTLEAETRSQKMHFHAVMEVVPTGVLVADRDGKLLYANREAERIWGHPLVQADSPGDYAQYRLYHVDGRRTGPDETILAQTLSTRTPHLRARRRVVRTDGSTLSVLANSVPLLDETGELNGAVVSFTDISELELLQRRQQRLTEIAQAVNADRPLKDVLRIVRDAVVETAGFERAGVWIHDPAAGGLRGAWGTDRGGAALDETGRFFPLRPDGNHPFSRVLGGDLPVYHAMADDAESIEPMCDGAAVGLSADERVVGMLFVDNAISNRPVSDEALQLLMPFCEQAATAIERSRLRQLEREQTAWLKEAVRITNHRVKNNLQVTLALLDTELMDEEPVDRSTLERIRRQIRIIGSVNEFLGDTSPELDTSLGDIVERVLGVFEAGRLVECSLECEEVVVTTKQATAVGLIVDELTNCAQARGATKVDVALKREDDAVVLELQDDGPALPDGFRVDPNIDKALGLVERLARWDLLGRVSYSSQGGGVCVAVTFPLDTPAAAAR